MGKRQSGGLPLFKEICGYDYWTIVVSERREICNNVNHCLTYLAKISCISGLYGKLWSCAQLLYFNHFHPEPTGWLKGSLDISEEGLSKVTAWGESKYFPSFSIKGLQLFKRATVPCRKENSFGLLNTASEPTLLSMGPKCNHSPYLKLGLHIGQGLCEILVRV